MHFTWNVCQNQYGSDHFPIILIPNSRLPETKNYPRWITNKADWAEFKNKLSLSLDHIPENLDCIIEKFTNTIIEAAQFQEPEDNQNPIIPHGLIRNAAITLKPKIKH